MGSQLLETISHKHSFPATPVSYLIPISPISFIDDPILVTNGLTLIFNIEMQGTQIHTHMHTMHKHVHAYTQLKLK